MKINTFMLFYFLYLYFINIYKYIICKIYKYYITYKYIYK